MYLDDEVTISKTEHDALTEMTGIFSNFLPAIDHCHRVMGPHSPFDQDLMDRAIHLYCSVIKETITVEE